MTTTHTNNTKATAPADRLTGELVEAAAAWADHHRRGITGAAERRLRRPPTSRRTTAPAMTEHTYRRRNR